MRVYTSGTQHETSSTNIANAPASPAVPCSDTSAAATTFSRIASPHTPDAVLSKSGLPHAGVDGFISGHSLRVGSAVSLAKAGATVVDMQVAGRWKSSQIPAHYAKAELAERGAIARFKDGKS